MVSNILLFTIGPGYIDQDDDRAGYDLGATGRLALMAKLAEGTGSFTTAQHNWPLFYASCLGWTFVG